MLTDIGDTHTISVAPNTNVGTFSATLGAESSNGSTGTVNWTFSATDAQISALVGAQQTVIPGWQQGIPGMKVGGVRLLKIPADLAYGASGQPPAIGPNEPLFFIVSVVSV